MIGAVVQAQDQRRPDFTSRVELVTTDVVVRDNGGQFIADLKKDDFEVIEDGVLQKVVSFSLTHGGRSYNIAAPPPAPVAEGILLPPSRPVGDAAGRIFLIFVDDLHLDFRNTGRIRDLFKKISDELVHEGDMFGIVSTGPSSISIDLTYDRRRLTEAIKKISGAGLAPKDILDVPQGSQGPPEVRHRAHVAFSTASDMMRQLEQVHNRRKAFIYVSNGYDLDPFAKTRAKNEAERYGALRNSVDNNNGDGSNNSQDPNDPALRGQGNQFAFADLVGELAELTRAAVRANTTIYTIDPARPGRRPGPRREDRHDGVSRLRSKLPGQPARARRPHRRHRRRQSERLHQSVEAYRPGNQRLLRGRLLLDEPGSDQEAPGDRGESHAAGRQCLAPDVVYAQTAAGPDSLTFTRVLQPSWLRPLLYWLTVATYQSRP